MAAQKFSFCLGEGTLSNAKSNVFVLASPSVKSNWAVIEAHSLSKA